jgi:hypothetical protein
VGKTYDTEKVIIAIRGGVAEVVEKSDNVVVIIKDYDVEGVEEDRLMTDESGDSYIGSTH